MLGEASNEGLILSKKKVDYYVYGKNSNFHIPDYKQKIHNSLTFKFMFADLFPRARFDGKSKKVKWDFRLWPKRKFKDHVRIHQSVIDKISTTKYHPDNIDIGSNKHEIEKNQNIIYNNIPVINTFSN